VAASFDVSCKLQCVHVCSKYLLQVECSNIVQHAEQIVKANGFADGEYLRTVCDLLNNLLITSFVVVALLSGSTYVRR